MSTTLLSKNKTAVPDHINKLLSDASDRQNGQVGNPFNQLRKKGGEILQKTGFPTTRNEDYKYTAVARIINEDYKLASSADISDEMETRAEEMAQSISDDSIRLSFINGALIEKLSRFPTDNGVTVKKLSDFPQDSSLAKEVQKEINEAISNIHNPFISLNTGLCLEPIVIEVQQNAEIDQPIHLSFYCESVKDSIINNPLIVILSRENSRLQIIESHKSMDHAEEFRLFTNVFVRAVVEKAAHLTHLKIQELNDEDYMIHNLIASQERDSHFYTMTTDLGSKMTRNNLEVHLKNSFTQTDMYGLFIGADRQHIDNQTFLDHAVPNCESREWYKGVLADRSRGVFNGKVLVRQDAQKTNAFQQNNTLLSSDHARMDSKPQLEIYADDVKCSHGATIGQMDKETLFYLMSRGLDINEAGELVKVAFLAEVFESINNESIRALIAEKVIAKLRQIR